jgi:hypothetical protein
MALLEKHRSTIYAHFVEAIGEEAAQAMLAEFPARNLDELATRDFVEAQVAQLRGEMRVGFAELRTDMAQLGSELERRLMTRLQILFGIGFGLLGVLTLVSR